MQRVSFLTVEKIGPKQSLTPEGFLLCEEVALARTGMMIYGPDETPIEAGPEGIVRIFRDADEVFSESTIASAQGKPVTDDHPDDDVTPENWKDLAVGVMLNVRRGEGALDDLLLGDLLITTQEGIEQVQSGKREVSLGYEADYIPGEVPGVGRQSGIIINHIALVENGRCGPRCAIKDHSTVSQRKGITMANKTKSKILDALMRAFKAKDSEEVEKIAEETADTIEADPDGDTHIHIHGNGSVSEGSADEDPDLEEGKAKFTDEDIEGFLAQNAQEHKEMMDRITALEGMIAGSNAADEEDPEAKEMMDEIPEELKETAATAKDSAYFADSFRDTAAQAEILAPGIRIPTFDSTARPTQTFKKICGLRRQALDLAYAQPATRGVIDELLSGADLDTKAMTCDAVRTLFRAAASVQRTNNNSRGSRTGDGAAPVKKVGVTSLADLNRINAERYNK